MNSRYLWSENLMMEGNHDVIWGFIDDVWHWSSNKISPFDTSKHPKQLRSRSFNRSENFNSSICSFENQKDLSPVTNKFMPQQEKETFSGMNIRDNATEVDVPNTRDQFSNLNTGVYNSPIRGSYSAKRLKRKTLITAQKMQSSQKKIPIPNQRRYSVSKKTEINLKSDSKQSPTFRPNHLSSARSRKSKLGLKPPRKEKKKFNKDVIGKDKEGKPVHSHFSRNNIAIDFIDDKPKNYHRKRISPEDEDKTREWLRRINFHNYLSSEQLDLMEDPMRNGIML